MDEVVVITGANKGLGLALSQRFADEGYRLVLSGRNREELKLVKDSLGDLAEVLTVTADVQKKDDCKRLIDECIKSYGKIDIMINNAGVWTDSMEPEMVDNIIDTNLKGVEYCSAYALSQMNNQEDGGIIVNIGSTSGIRFRPGGIYSSSKFGVVSYSGSLYNTYNQEGKIGVICFCPGGMKTQLFRTKPEWVSQDFMDPKVVAQVLFDRIRDREFGLFVLERDGTLYYTEFSISWNWKWQKKLDLSKN